MTIRKALLASLLGCTMLAGCNGSDDKAAAPADAVSQSTFDALKAEFDQERNDKRSAIERLQAELAANTLGLGQLAPEFASVKLWMATVDARLMALEGLSSRLDKLEANIKVVDVQALWDQFVELKKDYDEAVKLAANPQSATKLAAILARLSSGKVDQAMLDELRTDLQKATAALPKLGTDVTGFTTRIAALEGEVERLKAVSDEKLADYVNTTRGSINHDYARDDVARGNTFPATAVPFGFNMWTPVNTSNRDWFYDSTSNSMQAFAVTHEASGHNGNHQALKFMPVGDETRVNASEAYDRKDEIAKAHYYGVTFKNGMKTEITPTDHAAYVRFTAPAAFTKTTIAFDQFVGKGLLSVDQTKGTASGETYHNHDVHTPKLYFFIKFDRNITNFKHTSSDVAKGWVQFDTPVGAKEVGMRMATSFISVEQAEENFNQEITGKTFDDVQALAEKAWNDRLNTIRVEGATEDQKIILYSNMYRAFLYPNSAWEKVKGADGKYESRYSSPYTDNDKIKKGKIWVGNGFWDTYRTTWPLYTLLNPNEAGEMLDGFVNGYKDGGWTTRWSNPGYRDSMVATSLDVVLADAYLKGVKNFDSNAAYNSMVRNATAYSDSNDRGRKGMDQMPFYGYRPDGDYGTKRAVAWSLEAYLNDFGIFQMAKALGKTDDAAYLANRAISYANIFDASSTGTWGNGWFRTKKTDGTWASGPSTPQTWGYGYEEGNAWSYAFLAPQDGQGLANLYGGRDKLKAKLDTFFATKPGSDGGDFGMIHEVREAAEVAKLAPLLGEYQHSNQTVHHSIYMYNYAGAPSNTQNLVRDVMDKLYFTGFDKNGVSNGEGYIGDEDNGEQSAWYILSAMGFYPVSMGRPEYAIGAPYFPQMKLRLKDTKDQVHVLNIKAPLVSASNRYVQAVRLNGQPLSRNYLKHSEVAAGGTLEFDMGPNPSQWGTGVNDVPTSITQGSAKPSPLQSVLPVGYDVTASTPAQSASLVDRTSTSEWSSSMGAAQINAVVKAAKQPAGGVTLYTITSARTAGQDPTSWTLKGSNDGAIWVELDKRENQAFLWRQQTRPFALKTPASYKQYRLELGTGAVTIAEFELLGRVPLDAVTPPVVIEPVVTKPVEPVITKPVVIEPVVTKPVEPVIDTSTWPSVVFTPLMPRPGTERDCVVTFTGPFGSTERCKVPPR